MPFVSTFCPLHVLSSLTRPPVPAAPFWDTIALANSHQCNSDTTVAKGREPQRSLFTLKRGQGPWLNSIVVRYFLATATSSPPRFLRLFPSVSRLTHTPHFPLSHTFFASLSFFAQFTATVVPDRVVPWLRPHHSPILLLSSTGPTTRTRKSILTPLSSQTTRTCTPPMLTI